MDDTPLVLFFNPESVRGPSSRRLDSNEDDDEKQEDVDMVEILVNVFRSPRIY